MEDREIIVQNLQQIHHRINLACQKSGRDPKSVRLLMATKTVEPERIKIALDLGENLIGENKVQEYKEKWNEMKDFSCEKHFIGHLQTNKIKEIIRYVTCIESVDRLELAEKLQAKLSAENMEMDVYVEVNTSCEESKSGVSPDKTMELLQSLQAFPLLHPKGLMTIGMASEEEEKVRGCFRTLSALRQEAIALKLLPSESELSMGMSHDLEWAVEEGATIVRVGSAIFGNRFYPGK